jgi:hypothetical protein
MTIAERPIEVASEYIRRTSVLWIPVDDLAGSHSDRAVIERNAITTSMKRMTRRFWS